MKRSVLVALALMLTASVAFGAAGDIMVFSDAAGTNCNFTDTAGGYLPVYMFHANSTGATASEFMLVAPTTWTYLGDILPFFLTIGTPQVGCAVSYEACKTGSWLVAQTNFLGDGSSPVCSNTVYITAAPGKSTVEIIDCDENRAKTHGGAGVVNGDGSCPCNVPVEETTWGKVKSLYQ